MPILIALLLLLLPGALGAQEAVQPNTISVSGMATVERQPDQAVIQLAVESFGATAQEATAENSTKMDAVIRALRQFGLKQDQIRTLGFSVNPEYDYNPGTPRQPGEDRLVGYRARNIVQVTTDNVAEAGNIIDVAIKAGANRVNNLNFQLRDPEAARQEALRLAVEKARTEAETIASALGRRLGPALAATTTGAFAPPQPFAMRAMANIAQDMAAPPPPVEPGLIEVNAQVNVIYSLEPTQ
jgi:uncharacterized protein YggE